MLTVPPAILDLLHVHAGATVGLRVEGDHLVIYPNARSAYKLEELLAECDPEAPISEEDRAWLEGPPVGREL
jgi:antitoxin ChpS